jgi:hypothetical protein
VALWEGALVVGRVGRLEGALERIVVGAVEGCAVGCIVRVGVVFWWRAEPALWGAWVCL